METVLSPGTVVGSYRLQRQLGRGGMGIVWGAEHVDTARQVALKFMRVASPTLRERFGREARAASVVNHPNVVRVHEVIELDDGSPVLVMDRLTGESLAQRLRRDKKLDPDEAVPILLDIVAAVGTAHARGIIHRDLKPENVFLAEDDTGNTVVKVLDFGIAKVTEIDEEMAMQTGPTATGSLLGTPCYMSPEQAFGERDLDHRTDIWSLGIIAYECLSGTLPTRADNLGQVLKIVLTRQIPPLYDAAPDVPRPLSELVDRMLSRRRQQRPADLREVQRALATLIGADVEALGPPVRPPAEVVAERAATRSLSSVDTLDVGESAPPRTGRKKGPPGGGGIVRTVVPIAAMTVVLAMAAAKLRGAAGDAAPDAGSSTPGATTALVTPPASQPSTHEDAAPSRAAPSAEPAPAVSPATTTAASAPAAGRGAGRPLASASAVPRASASAAPGTTRPAVSSQVAWPSEFGEP